MIKISQDQHVSVKRLSVKAKGKNITGQFCMLPDL